MSKSFDGDIRLSVGLDTGQAEKDAKKLGKDVASAVSSGGKSSKILEIEAQLRKAKDAAADAKKKLDDLKNTKMPTDEFASLSEQARELADRYAELAKLKERWSDMGIDPNSTAAADQPMIATLRALEKEMDEVYRDAERTTAKMAEMMQAGTAYKAPETTAEWAEAARQVSYTSDRVGVLQAKLREAQTEETQAANTVVTGSARAASALAKLKAVGATVGRVLLSGLKAAGRAAGQLAAKLGRVVGRATITGLKKVASGITGIGRRADHTGLSIGRLLKYAVGLIGLGTLLSKMRSAIADGIQTLAASDNNLNARLNETKAALANLKLSFAAAFQPILSVVLPIINTLANALSSVINKIGMFFAVLTGQNYYNKVVSTAGATESYASAIEDTGTAAAEAAEEMEKYLSPVDELNKMQDTSKSGSSGGSGGGGGGGGTGGGGGGDYFEQVAIDSPISEFADKVKALINAEDWEGLGELLADKVNGCLQKVYDAINWDNIGPKITKFVTAFTETFNSFVDNIDWELAGRTVGAGINTVVNTLDLAITGINWTNLGRKFATGVNGLVDEVEWENLGKMIGEKVMILPDIAAGFVTTVNWDTLGSSISQSINGFFKTFSLPEIGTTLGQTLNGIFRTIRVMGETIEFDALSEQISGGINNLFSTIEPGEWAEGLGTFLANLQQAVADAILAIKWEEIAQKISEFVEKIPWEKVVRTSLDIGGKLINGLQEFLGELLSGTDWTDILSEIMLGIYNWLVHDMDWGKFFQGLLGVLKGILLDLPLAIIMAPIDFLCKVIFGKDAEAVWNDIVEWFKGVGSAMWGALVQAWNGVSEFFQNVWKLLTDPFVNAAKWFGEIFTNAWDAICKAWDNVGLWFQKLWAYIKLVAVEALEAILGFLDTTLGWIPGLGDSIRSAKDAVAGVADSIRAEIDDINKEMDENLGKTRTVPVELKKTIGWTEEDSPLKLVKKMAAATTVVSVDAKQGESHKAWFGTDGSDGKVVKTADKAGKEGTKKAKVEVGAWQGTSHKTWFGTDGSNGKAVKDSEKSGTESKKKAKVEVGAATDSTFTKTIVGYSSTVMQSAHDMQKGLASKLYNTVFVKGKKDQSFLNIVAGAATSGSILSALKTTHDTVTKNKWNTYGVASSGFTQGFLNLFDLSGTKAGSALKVMRDAKLAARDRTYFSYNVVSAGMSEGFKKLFNISGTAAGSALKVMRDAKLAARDRTYFSYGVSSGGMTDGFKTLFNLSGKAAGSALKVMRDAKIAVTDRNYTKFGVSSGGKTTGFKTLFGAASVAGSALNAMKKVKQNSGGYRTFSVVGGDSRSLKDYLNARIREMNSAIINIRNNTSASKFFGSITKNMPTIPYLAQGAVIPAGAPFLAMLGDQSNGRNLEAPESLIRQIVREETAAIAGLRGGGSTKVVAQVGRKTLFEVLIDEAKLQQQITGRNPFDI